MDKVKLEIEDYYVLLNLHKALLEAKFHLNPDNPLVSGSPIIADLSNEIVDILSHRDILKDSNNAGKWDEWRKLEKQGFYRERAVQNAVLMEDRWSQMEHKDKICCARNLLSPFKATDEELESFMEEVDIFCCHDK